MKSRFLILIFLLPAWIYGQSPHLDSLRNELPFLKDSARIDKLNVLSQQFLDLSEKDSALFYADLALNESKSISYIHGIAVSLSTLGIMKTFFGSDFPEAERLDLESIAWFEKTKNKSGLAPILSHVAFVFFSESKYEDALHYADKAYELYYNDHDSAGMLDIMGLKPQIYLKRGEFDKAFNFAQQESQMNSALKNSPEYKGNQLGLGTVCMGIEDYALALNYYRPVFQDLSREDSMDLVKSEDLIWAKMEFAEIYSHLGMFDSALYRYNLLDTSGMPDKDLRIFLVSKGEYFMLRKDYEKALPMLLRGLAIHEKLNDGNEIVRTVLDIANTYYGLQNEKEALAYAWRGLHLGMATGARQRMRDAYKVLFSVYDQRGKTDSAYYYYRTYIHTKELLTDDQTKGKFAADEYLEKIKLLNQEKLISEQRLKIQNQQLKKENLIRNILTGIVLIVLILGVLVFRNILLIRRNEKLKSENIRRELIHKTTEMEMQALRAQMNPHFVFNCLNSINSFIMKNESQAASDYLTQFSRLMRMVLNNSKKTWITLEDEIDMLRLYLDMEKLRFKNAFRYELLCGNGVDPPSLFIPPLLLQPFVENAIWHGLMHKKENGLVTISFTIENNILHCTVIDNGIGRAEAAIAGSKSSQIHKSMGIQITKDRLALINHELDQKKVIFQIEDMIDNEGRAAGTKVNLSIRLQKFDASMEGMAI